MSAGRSSYIHSQELLKHNFSRANVLKRFVSVFSCILAFAVLLLPFSGVFSNPSSERASADGVEILCSSKNELGPFIDQYPWRLMLFNYPSSDASNRMMNGMEALGNGVRFVDYQGEGKGALPLFTVDVGEDRGAGIGNWDQIKDELKKQRGGVACLATTFSAVHANFYLAIAAVTSNIINSITTMPFDPNLFCTSSDSGGCVINLVKLVGGTPTADGSTLVTTGGGGGLIGLLTQGFYLPMLVLLSAIVGVSIGWKGLVRRQYRAAFADFAWACFAVIFGLAFLFNPMLVAKAPMYISNTLGACIIGAFQGDNCLSTDTSDVKVVGDDGEIKNTSASFCKTGSTDPSLGMDEQLSLMISGLNCQIWKAFVLEPWTQQTFSNSFEALDISNPTVKQAAADAGFPNPEEKFCVNLQTSSPIKSQGKTLNLDKEGNKVCNLAAYQMYLQVNASSGGDTNPKTADTPDTRWYPLLMTLSKHDDAWLAWSLHNIFSGFETAVSILSVVIGGVFLFVCAMFALVYYIMGALLMVFAPFFLLIGVHPGRGKKLMLGWLEQVISSILKYVATAMLLMVGITFYGTILGETTSAVLALIFVLIMTVALLIYRKEFTNMLGQINLGGERAIEKLNSGNMSSLMQKGKGVAAAAAGSAAGAAIGSDRTDREQYFRTVAAAAGDGARRSMRSGMGNSFMGQTTANAFRQVDRVSADNKSDLASNAREAMNAVADKGTQYNKAKDKFDAQMVNVGNAGADLTASAGDLQNHIAGMQGYLDFRNEADAQISEEDKDFGELMKLGTEIEGLDLEHKLAIVNGDQDRADKIQVEIDHKRNLHKAMERDLREKDPMFDERLARYNAQLHAGGFGEQDLAFMRDGFDDIKKRYENDKNIYDAEVQRANLLRADMLNTAADKAHAETLAKELTDAHRRIAAGELVTGDDLRRMRDRASADADVAARDARAGIPEEKIADDALREKFELDENYRQFGMGENALEGAKRANEMNDFAALVDKRKQIEENIEPLEKKSAALSEQAAMLNRDKRELQMKLDATPPSFRTAVNQLKGRIAAKDAEIAEVLKEKDGYDTRLDAQRSELIDANAAMVEKVGNINELHRPIEADLAKEKHGDLFDGDVVDFDVVSDDVKLQQDKLRASRTAGEKCKVGLEKLSKKYQDNLDQIKAVDAAIANSENNSSKIMSAIKGAAGPMVPGLKEKLAEQTSLLRRQKAARDRIVSANEKIKNDQNRLSESFSKILKDQDDLSRSITESFVDDIESGRYEEAQREAERKRKENEEMARKIKEAVDKGVSDSPRRAKPESDGKKSSGFEGISFVNSDSSPDLTNPGLVDFGNIVDGDDSIKPNDNKGINSGKNTGDDNKKE